MNLMDIKELYKFADALERGIDPTTGIVFSEDTILSNPQIVHYNSEIKNILKKIIILNSEEAFFSSVRKLPFFLLDEDKEKIVLSDEPISIGEFCRIINEYRLPDMRNLKASNITNVLVKKELLETVYLEDGRKNRIPTFKGIEIGIFTEDRIGKYGTKYKICLYSLEAQRYILSNIL